MSIQVEQFDERKAKQALKKCPQIVRDYVKLLEQHLEHSKQTTQMAIAKIRELSKPPEL